MSKLHFYINGTPNGTDGEEVTQLTFKNIKKYMISYALGINSNFRGYFSYPLLFCIRFEDGYKGNVTIKSLLSNIKYYIVGTSFPTSSFAFKKTDSSIDVTNKNCLIVASQLIIDEDGYSTTNRYAGFSDIPLKDMFSFSYILEKA